MKSRIMRRSGTEQMRIRSRNMMGSKWKRRSKLKSTKRKSKNWSRREAWERAEASARRAEGEA